MTVIQARGQRTERQAIYLDEADRGRRYPDAVVAGGLVFTSGARSTLPGGSFATLPPEARVKQQGYPLVDDYEGRVTASAWRAHQQLEDILVKAGSDNSQILRQHVWQKDKRFFPCYEQVRRHWQPVPSPSSGLGVTAIPGECDAWIGLDAIAVVPGADPLFGAREVVAAVDLARLPSASHYSQAVRSGPLVFTAGHIPIKTAEPGKPVVQGFDDIPPEGRTLATGRSHPDSRDGPIAAQTWYVYAQLRDLLASAGLSFDDVVLSTVYLADVRDFAVFHRAHGEAFGTHQPALAVSGFNEVGHRGCRIEIELTVLDPAYGLAMRPIAWDGSPPFAAPAGMAVGPFVFFSGMLGHDPAGNLVRSASDLPEAIGAAIAALGPRESRPDFVAQTFAALSRLGEAVCSAGGDWANLVKMTVYVENEADIELFEVVRAWFIADDLLPATEFVIVHGPGPLLGALVQIEAIAAV